MTTEPLKFSVMLTANESRVAPVMNTLEEARAWYDLHKGDGEPRLGQMEVCHVRMNAGLASVWGERIK